MAPREHVKAHEWLQIQPLLSEMYLAQDLTLNEVFPTITDYFRSNFNLNVSQRQTKLRFEKWGWIKKIPEDYYVAMQSVVEQYPNQRLAFTVMTHHGKHYKRVDMPVLKKEMKRKELKLRTQRLSDLEARRYLQLRNIHIEPAWLNLSNPSGDSDDEVEATNMDLRDDASILSDGNGAHPQVDSHDEEVNNNLSDYRGRHSLYTDVSSTSSAAPRRDLPSNSIALGIHSSLLPHRPGHQVVENGSDDSIHSSPILTKNVVPQAVTDYLLNFTQLLAWQRIPHDPEGHRRRVWENFLGVRIADYYSVFDRDDCKRDIIEFTAYYVQQLLAGYESLDAYNDSDRHEARQKLKLMLEQDNPLLLLTITWISQVLMSHDRRALVSGFLDDCFECVRESQSWTAGILRPVVHLLIAVEEDSRPGSGPAASILLQRLNQMAETRNLEAHFRTSISQLELRQPEQKSALLTMKSYYGWYLLYSQQHRESLHLLLDVLPVIENFMGLNHVVTVRCIVMIAQCYEMESDLPMAAYYYGTAHVRLNYCEYPLRLLRSRYTQKLAELEIRLGRFHEAETHLEEVLALRVQTLGPYSRSTYWAAQDLFSLLRSQNRHAEAQHREAELERLVDTQSR